MPFSPSPPPARQARTPLHLCALTLARHANPVAAPDGTVFEAASILPLVRRTRLNPITGAPLPPSALVPLSFSVDPRSGAFRCPVLFRRFADNVKVVAIATSGNVYSYAAVQRHNLHPRSMRDLLDGSPFSLDDILVLFDPALHVWSADVSEHAPPPLPHPHPHPHPHPAIALRRPSPPVTISPQSVHRPVAKPNLYPPRLTDPRLPPVASVDTLLSSDPSPTPAPPTPPPPPPLPQHHPLPNISRTTFSDIPAPAVTSHMHQQVNQQQQQPQQQPQQQQQPPQPPQSQPQSQPRPQPLPLPQPQQSQPLQPQPQPQQQQHHHAPVLSAPAPTRLPSQSQSPPLHPHHHPITHHLPTTLHPAAYPPTPTPHTGPSTPPHIAAKRGAPKKFAAPVVKRPRLQPNPARSPPLPPNHSYDDHQLSMAKFYQRRRAEDERKLVYKRIRKGRKGKGYVRVVTNIGHLNIELHCDKVPMTCDNFLTLAERKYYDGLLWHSVVPGFIAQTGDRTGTGDGGDSAWGGCIKDEIRTSLNHDAPGVVSMANSGRDTNRSQWFICFDAAQQLDGAHTVFGKVVGGLYVLKKMENEAEMGHPLTVEKIEVLVNPIRQIRDQMSMAQIPPNVSNAGKSPPTMSSQASTVVSTVPPSPTEEQEQHQKAAASAQHMAAGQTYDTKMQVSNEPRLPSLNPPCLQPDLPSARSLLSGPPMVGNTSGYPATSR